MLWIHRTFNESPSTLTFLGIISILNLPAPARKNRRTGAAFLPEPLLPRRPNPAPSGATAQSFASPFRIRGEKSPNINQKRQQFRRKLKITRKRRNASHVWRAGRNSPLKPPFRPARFLVGVFGDLGNQGEGCPRRKNEGAVADQRLLTALTAFFSSQGQSQGSRRPTSASAASVAHPWLRPVWPLRTVALLPVVRAPRASLYHTGRRRARTEVRGEKRKSTASRRVHRLCTNF